MELPLDYLYKQESIDQWCPLTIVNNDDTESGATSVTVERNNSNNNNNNNANNANNTNSGAGSVASSVGAGNSAGSSAATNGPTTVASLSALHGGGPTPATAKALSYGLNAAVLAASLAAGLKSTEPTTTASIAAASLRLSSEGSSNEVDDAKARSTTPPMRLYSPRNDDEAMLLASTASGAVQTIDDSPHMHIRIDVKAIRTFNVDPSQFAARRRLILAQPISAKVYFSLFFLLPYISFFSAL